MNGWIWNHRNWFPRRRRMGRWSHRCGCRRWKGRRSIWWRKAVLDWWTDGRMDGRKAVFAISYGWGTDCPAQKLFDGVRGRLWDFAWWLGLTLGLRMGFGGDWCRRRCVVVLSLPFSSCRHFVLLVFLASDVYGFFLLSFVVLLHLTVIIYASDFPASHATIYLPMNISITTSSSFWPISPWHSDAHLNIRQICSRLSRSVYFTSPTIILLSSRLFL